MLRVEVAGKVGSIEILASVRLGDIDGNVGRCDWCCLEHIFVGGAEIETE